jgi:uncharacterized protein (DUF362 family)
MSTPFMNKGRYLVSKVTSGSDLKESIKKAIDLIGGIDRVIKSGDKVTIKPNLNTADPYPASSDPAFIQALGELILEAGASKLEIIDSSTMRLSTRDVAQKIGLDVVAEALDADLIFLDEHDWVKVEFPKGKYMKSGSIGKPILDIEKLVLAPCLKTHFLAWYTGSMKIFVGWLKHSQRIRMHMRHLQPKIADLASYFNPDLIVMDARTCFITGGPASGTCSTPGTILASGDMVSIDVEGVRIIQCCNADNKLNMDVWMIPQIKRAVEIGFGATSDSDIEVIEGE